MAKPEIRCEIGDGVALVTMDFPPVNAQNTDFHQQMMATMDRLSDNADVAAVVLTGAGKIFSAGADLKARQGRTNRSGPGGQWAHLREGRETYHSVAECRKPVIGALNGPALGAGLAVAASCDILISAERGSLGLPEIDVGVIGGGRHAMRLFGHSLTRRMALTGYRAPAADLLRLGVVEAVVPADALLPTAMKLAGEIAATPMAATMAAREILSTVENMSLRDGLRFEQSALAALPAADGP